jgi:hypothetical protein
MKAKIDIELFGGPKDGQFDIIEAYTDELYYLTESGRIALYGHRGNGDYDFKDYIIVTYDTISNH